MLKSAIQNYKKHKAESRSKENFEWSKKSMKRGSNDAFYIFIILIALIFLILEIVLLYFALMIALHCSKTKEERIVNVILAIVFTIPYVLLNILFNPCAKQYLGNRGSDTKQ